jgi:hypothetical protein
MSHQLDLQETQATTWSQKMKLTTTTMMSWTPFNIHKSNVQVANKQLANAGYTYKLMVVFYQGK